MNNALRQSLLAVLFVSLAIAQTETNPPMESESIDCKVCHLCEKPTVADPCLRECPRFREMALKAGHTQMPQVIVIDVLSKLYVPVVFSHQFHAEMSQMSNGCNVCHHHNPSQTMLSCRHCHPVSPVRADLSNPSLRGAYHRQCLGCHREWSYESACSVCHALKSSLTEGGSATDTTDIIGLAHPPIKEPEKIIYDSNNKDGPLITFFHQEHTSLFGLKCTQCHKKENCSRCHDQAVNKTTELSQSKSVKPLKVDMPEEQHHKACNGCHKKNKCSFCHAKTERGPFNHLARTGWNQTNFHPKLACVRCHTQSGRFKGLHKECASCHESWSPEKFKHALTGLRLDENHFELDCTECHRNGSYLQNPDCSNCHEEDYVYPAKKPGQNVHKN